MTNNEILVVKGITKRFGGLVAVDHVDIEIIKGERHVIIGPNGSGKTTFINVLTGVYRPEEGSIKLNNSEITNLQPHEIVERGVARTFQNIRLFGSMNVWENIALGMHCRTKTGVIGSVLKIGKEPEERRQIEQKVREVASLIGIEKILEQGVRKLPYGQQKIIEIGRAMAASPEILILDEPAAGMNNKEVIDLADIIKRISNFGVTVMLIEHNMDFVKDIANRVTVLDSGKKIAEGTFEEVRKDPKVIGAYFGKRGEVIA